MLYCLKCLLEENSVSFVHLIRNLKTCWLTTVSTTFTLCHWLKIHLITVVTCCHTPSTSSNLPYHSHSWEQASGLSMRRRKIKHQNIYFMWCAYGWQTCGPVSHSEEGGWMHFCCRWERGTKTKGLDETNVAGRQRSSLTPSQSSAASSSLTSVWSRSLPTRWQETQTSMLP